MKGLDVIFEIKQLHLSIGRRLFEMHHQECDYRHPSPLQMEVISILLKRKGQEVYPKDLQEELKISKAAISDVIDKMEKKKLIQKQPSKEDGRKTKLMLLPKGEEIYLYMENNIKMLSKEILADVSSEEIEEFLRISLKIQNNIRKRD